MKSFLFIFTLLFIVGCNCYKKVDSSNSSEETAYLKEGFIKGTIIEEPGDGGCPYIIQVAGDTPNFMDPINLNDDYKKDGLKIWFKYGGLNMMNRCIKANPVSILEIKERKK